MEWVVGFAALLVVWWLWSIRRGNLPFWKLVARHPDEAYQYFLKEDCWFVDEVPINIDKADITGPFQFFVPSLGGKRVKVYCLAKDLDDSQEAFRSWLAGTGFGQ